MKEIGGYFEIELRREKEYHQGALGLSSARNALIYWLKANAIQSLCLPYYLCDSVARACQKIGVKTRFYAIDRDFLPRFEGELSKGEAFYLVNYFGQLRQEEVSIFQKRFERLIVDHTQAFFERPLLSCDTLYSCRKYFGVPDGAYLYAEGGEKLVIPKGRSAFRMGHLLGRYEDTASAHYALFKQNDESFHEEDLFLMSDLTRGLLSALDYEAVSKQRKSNYCVLSLALADLNPLKPHEPIGPFAYPFYHEDGMRLKKCLAEQKIYVPTLWPNVLRSEDPLAEDYARNILPLPCDQRYGAEDMNRIAEVLKSCMR